MLRQQEPAPKAGSAFDLPVVQPAAVLDPARSVDGGIVDQHVQRGIAFHDRTRNRFNRVIIGQIAVEEEGRAALRRDLIDGFLSHFRVDIDHNHLCDFCGQPLGSGATNP